MDGKTPRMLTVTNHFRGRHSLYVTIAELGNWAEAITAATQEGERYHNSLELFREAEEAIAAFFDGSMGTYTDIMTGETKNYPVIASWEDINGMFYDDYNSRLVYWPLYVNPLNYVEKNNAAWYSVLTHWVNRVKRFCKFNQIRFQKLIQTMMIEYNPIADYWTKEQEIGGGSQIDISSAVDDKFDVYAGAWYNDKQYKNESANQSGGTAALQSPTTIQNNHYTTTYDDDSESRLESYDTQTGGTTTHSVQTNPAEGYFKQRKEEGNKGTVSPQDMVVKEFDIAQLWNIVEIFMNELAKEIFLQIHWQP